MNRYKLVNSIFLIIILSLYLVKVWIESEIAILGVEYWTVQQKKDRLQKANILLQEEILYEQSLMTISKKANTQGFVPATNTIYIYEAL